ncbi:hypothetical protein Cfla_1423 [Cellulomonas flavigena DSM 20109]|uniref:Uncharacterized protein n=1 Tax=Cellulomonas flavigena (strain ATCC 482 / DSM 20109 / BCRC 11376 / JCM 18109 / NBRC 3775 / NCIMB 8073 / NRS 134) TaxID=446466 RepID=D5UCK7_CELFN|nr:hypothetical protein Cfla_1423 [Cellulomonas flavigena DSM 20109]
MTDGAAKQTGALVGFTFVNPEGWMGWEPGSGIRAVAREIASHLADVGSARDVTARSVELVNADSLGKNGIVAHNAVWVPDRRTGEVAAILDMVVISAPGGETAPEQRLARNLRRSFGWTTRIVEYAADTAHVPAGRMTIEQVLLRRFGERQVQAYLFLNVFPPGAVEAASLVFNTVHLDLVTEVARQGRMIAESLVLELGEIPGGRRQV